MSITAARRHLDRTLSALAAEYGRVEVVRERHEVSMADYERLRERTEALNSPGGAAAWVRDPDGRILLVETEEGWAEPGTSLQPGQEYVECAEAAVRRHGVTPALTGLSHVHIRHVVDGTDRPPLPQPLVVFDARANESVESPAEWHDRLPERLLYEYLRELR
ncbi:hypothetical protein [Halosegnis sp.]|uniref:hypothetical protein n=1 Tax=Halosegnis sp. TaxID=2864959 RepID=UPI0035D49D80